MRVQQQPVFVKQKTVVMCRAERYPPQCFAYEQRRDQLRDLWGLVQKENVRPLVYRLLRILKQ